MKISQKNRDLMFNVIDNSIMDLRIKLLEKGGDIDMELFKLSIEIWHKLKENLKFKD